MHWDIYCRVVDNYGDIGVCWRLAADLARRGDGVRLWIDDASAMAWMAPEGAPGVQVMPWPAAAHAGGDPQQADSGATEPLGDVVVEAFGCALPQQVVAAMAAQAARGRAPVWINLEYLSAEDYVERSHGLPSPQADWPGRGLTKRFFYPGFTAGTGGLLRESDLAQRQAKFDGRAWQRAQGIKPAAGERCVSLFCYENAAIPALIDALAEQPTLLLATAGHAARQVGAALGPALRRGHLRAQVVPALTQREYDHLLWSCDLNCVRGEDSFVRAQWAGKPFLWHIYPQDDGVHAVKLAAFQHRFLADAPPALAAAVTRAGLMWNGLAPLGVDVRPPSALWPAWQSHCAAWRDRLLRLPDLTASLQAFVREHR